LVGPVNHEAPQQVAVHRIGRMFAGEVWLLVNRLQSHLLHQSTHPLAIHRVALPPQPARHLSRTEDRIRQVRFVDHPHQPQVHVGFRLRLVIVARPRQAEEFALPGNRQRGMFGFNHAAALLNARVRQLFF
jgi:hypothetical protein